MSVVDEWNEIHDMDIMDKIREDEELVADKRIRRGSIITVKDIMVAFRTMKRVGVSKASSILDIPYTTLSRWYTNGESVMVGKVGHNWCKLCQQKIPYTLGNERLFCSEEHRIEYHDMMLKEKRRKTPPSVRRKERALRKYGAMLDNYWKDNHA